MTTRPMFLVTALLLVVGALFIASANPVFAQEEDANAAKSISKNLDEVAKSSYSIELRAPMFVGKMISALLAATGIVFLIITVYAGILYMTAMGDIKKIEKAKGMLTSSIIGLIIIVGAYAITHYVVEALSKATEVTT